MKQRSKTVKQCLQLISNQLSDAKIKHIMQAKHLYHDCDEITVYLSTQINTGQ